MRTSGARYTVSSSSSALVAFSAVRWAFHLVKERGYLPYRGPGIAISLGIVLGFALAALLIDYVLARMGVPKRLRSALWFGALFGPYAGLLADNAWQHPVWSHVIGVASTVAGFGLGYLLERRASIPWKS